LGPDGGGRASNVLESRAPPHTQERHGWTGLRPRRPGLSTPGGDDVLLEPRGSSWEPIRYQARLQAEIPGRSKQGRETHGAGSMAMVTSACTVWWHSRSVTAVRGCRPADPVWAWSTPLSRTRSPVSGTGATDGLPGHGLGEVSVLPVLAPRSRASYVPANGSSGLPSMVLPWLASTHDSDVMLLNRGHVGEINGPMFGTLGSSMSSGPYEGLGTWSIVKGASWAPHR
jgi:hypothetical protein